MSDGPYMIWWLCPVCAAVQETGDLHPVAPALRPYVEHFLRTRGRLVPLDLYAVACGWTCDCCQEPQSALCLAHRFE